MANVDGSRHSIGDRTLHIRYPLGQTLALAIVILPFILIAVETVLRFGPLALRLPNSNLGGSHSQFENQVARLEKVTVTDGPIDCIFVGSSLVWLDINPEVFEKAYRQETGQKIHCFNFGVEAMPATATAGLAPYLVENYKPKLLIYGVHARDLGTSVHEDDAQAILQNPWYRYQNGDFSFYGWLAEHSRIFRNADYLARLLRFDFAEAQALVSAPNLQKHGFDPKISSKWDVDSLPDKEDPGLQNGINFYGQFKIREENLEALKKLSTLTGEEAQVIVVAMPVHPNFYQFFGEGERDYANFIEQVDDTLSSSGIPFVQTTEFPTPDKDSWWDYSHLTLDGANIFSDWLGKHIGRTVQNGA